MKKRRHKKKLRKQAQKNPENIYQKFAKNNSKTTKNQYQKNNIKKTILE